MREVKLTNGLISLIDDVHFDQVAKFTWYYSKGPKNRSGYAIATEYRDDGSQITIRMHRLIMGAQPGQIVDHINGDGLDNRKSCNLRFSTSSQNQYNQPKRNCNTSGFKGVFLTTRRSKPWRAKIYVDKKVIHIGYFAIPEEAAEAYNKASTANQHSKCGSRIFSKWKQLVTKGI